MWAIGIYDLRLNDSQFWRLTLKQFNLLLKRKKAENKETEYLHAMVASVIANINRAKGTKPFKPQDFMRKERKPMTTEQLYKMLELITIANGGEVIDGDSRGIDSQTIG